jgi:hypothetical protein
MVTELLSLVVAYFSATLMRGVWRYVVINILILWHQKNTLYELVHQFHDNGLVDDWWRNGRPKVATSVFGSIMSSSEYNRRKIFGVNKWDHHMDPHIKF